MSLPTQNADKRRTAARLLQVFNFQETMQLPDPRGMPHLAQRLGFNLADAFARDAELFADFLERARIAVTQTEAQFQHLALALSETAQHIAQFVLQQTETRHVRRIFRGLIFDEIAEA